MLDKIVLGEDGPNHNKKIYSLHSFKGQNLFEIRKYYYKNGDFFPTKQGINLNRSNFEEFRNVIIRKGNEIESFLDKGELEPENFRYHQAQLEAKQNNIRLTGDVTIKEESNHMDDSLFQVRHKGNEDIVILNTAHSFCKAISINQISNSTPEEIRGLFARFISAYAKSRSLLLHSNSSSPKIFYSQHEHDWSDFLKNYLEDDS